jgi:hypothetical protein
MFIKNNQIKAQYFHYKISGKSFKRLIPALTEIEIPELTDESQIITNTFERRLRNIQENFGYNFETKFEEPSDPDFTRFLISTSATTLGNISSSINVSKGQNQIIYMYPNTFGTSATTLGSSGGTISPSGSSVSSTGYYYLSALNVDGNANQLSAATGNVSATTTYTFNRVITNHSITATFSYVTGSTVFTMTPNTNYYLKTLTLNGTSVISSVSGSVSGVSTYTLTNIMSANTLNATFKPFGQ